MMIIHYYNTAFFLSLSPEAKITTLQQIARVFVLWDLRIHFLFKTTTLFTKQNSVQNRDCHSEWECVFDRLLIGKQVGNYRVIKISESFGFPSRSPGLTYTFLPLLVGYFKHQNHKRDAQYWLQRFLNT